MEARIGKKSSLGNKRLKLQQIVMTVSYFHSMAK